MPDAQPVAPEDVRLPSPSPSEPHLLEPHLFEPALNVRLPSPTPSEDLLDPQVTRPDPSWPTLPTNEDPIPPSFTRSRSPSPEPAIPNPQRRRRQPPVTGRIRTALGLNTPGASLAWRLGFGTTEIVIIAVLLGLASVPGSVPFGAGLETGWLGRSQWEACGRPLGPWNIVWAVKAVIGLGMAGWEYWRSVRPSTDQLLAVERARLSREVRRARRETAQARRSRQSARGENAEGVTSPPRAVVRTPRVVPTRDVWTMGGGREGDLDLIDATMSGSSRSLQIVERMRKMRARREREERWYSRCTSLIALYGLVWFVTANILLYGSMDTCRYTSPYIWWLTFGILCLGYIVVAEMLLVALVVFVIGPLLLLSINIVLVCLGRHPIQPAGRMGHINPDIAKMPRGMVDRIPLVMYIPMPGDQPTTTEPEPTTTPEHSYPPKPKRRRFFFFRKKSKADSKPDSGVVKGDGDLEAGYEKTDYPFVKLESNRAACAICLMDFEPPRKVGEEGSGGEPLRLLACGHVFHKDCLDPWLVDVSGRCPTCQRPVEEEDLDPETGGKKEKRRWRRRS